MTAWIATQRHWLLVERLPGYAHDLNPIEMVWGNVKAVELANLCPQTIHEAHAPPSPACNVSAQARTCALPSSPTPAFPMTSDHPITETSLRPLTRNQAVSTRPRLMAPLSAALRTDRGRLGRGASRAVEPHGWTICRRRQLVLVLVGPTTVTEGVEPPAVQAGWSPLHALVQRVLRRRGRHDLQPLQFSTDTGDVTVCLVEHLQAYLDSTPVS